MPGRMLCRLPAAAAVAALVTAGAAQADTLKIGAILPMTGPFQSTGAETQAAVRLFLAQKGDTVGGQKIEILYRDDNGIPDKTKRLAQELITNDHVQLLFGFGLTPSALAVAPLSADTKVPMIVTVASTSIVVDKSPYVVRTIQTIPQIANVVGAWAAKNGIKSAVSLVSDYAPGHDADQWFTKSFEAGGGKVAEHLAVPLSNPDFSPFLQRVHDAAPEALFVFMPAGVGGTFAKQFAERGLDKSGIKVVSMSDVMDDDLLNGMGDPVIGIVSGGPYSAAHDSAANKAFVAAFKAANNDRRPNIVAVAAYDGMELIYRAVAATKGSTDGTALVEAMKGQQWESPRGPVSIDPATRDIVQNIYMRKVERRDGELYNVEFETVPAVKDPAH